MKPDVAIVGGGLAGLSLAIQLADAGKRAVVFERKKYPFHRVCGEYVSMESWDFLERLGMPLQDLRLPRITKLKVSSLKGTVISHTLSPGGFGISRFLLDQSLAAIARIKGVDVRENTSVKDLAEIDSEVIVGSFGKRSTLDRSMNRSSAMPADSAVSNWVGVKYHIEAEMAGDEIQLHNFDGGYCGISKVEGAKYCLCYMTRAINLQRFKGDIKAMESTLLASNPYLRKIFMERKRFLFKEPVTISQITFERKQTIEKHVLMVGDAAGMIAPLFGNGMSMAFHASLIAASLINQFIEGRITRTAMESEYRRQWNRQFSLRLQMGRILQPLLLRPALSDPAIALLRRTPWLMNKVVSLTHGKSF